ncbi:MAG: hypothetical protein A3B68_03430 [Candidatus Melainabacteria bacterium RIFCSPHIGHO2_02_FULL_34_12]|nr:MAG: hypothetical protein A3B68_03430 [Candidatus Melainabacteria bacterium RIFCSPHIGHO2_02_FULL_34_12]
MISEFQKYRAQLFQISGFAFATPFGRLILKLLDLEPIALTIRFFIVLVISIFLLICGILLLIKGFEGLD